MAMKPESVQRYLRQIALPEVGPAGQERLAAATVALAGQRRRDEDGPDVVVEIAARYLAAAGVGSLRLIGAVDGPGLEASLAASNPDALVTRAPWPADGPAWIDALAGVDLVLRSGFDDDAMMRAAVRLGIPAIVARAGAEKAELISFRRQGPCPHAPLDIPRREAAGGAAGGAAAAGAAAVVAGTLAAAEAIQTLLAAAGDLSRARARHLALPLDGGEPRAQDIPWSPECFACGGSATEMSFS
jgi:hypothetical protein